MDAHINVGGITSVGNFLWDDMNVVNIKFDILGYIYKYIYKDCLFEKKWSRIHVPPMRGHLQCRDTFAWMDRFYCIYKVTHCIDHFSMRTLYCSLFLPHLMYCCEIWGNTYVTNIQCIILIQKE